MKSIRRLLSRLRALGIKIWAENGQLRMQAPKGALTTELREELKSAKDEMLQFLETAEKAQAHKQPITPAPPNSKPLASFAQKRLWLLDQLDPGRPLYNVVFNFAVKGNLDISALEGALGEIIRRHDILRTSFSQETDGAVVQVISPPTQFEMTLIDLSRLPDMGREKADSQVRESHNHLSFDLQTGPLLSVVLNRLQPDHASLLITMHHVITDAGSRHVLISELSALYHAFSQGKPSPLTPLQCQYRDYAWWQRKWLEGDEQNTLLAYWKSNLEGASPFLDLPLDKPRPKVRTYAGKQIVFQVPTETARRWNTFSTASHATHYMTYLAAFKLLLFHYTGQTDILTGSAIANRNHPGTEDLIGFFVNMLVMRNDLSGDPTFEQLVHRVRKTSLEAFAHQDAPFEKLVEHLQPRRDTARTPFFQVVFDLQTATEQSLTMPDLSLELLDNQTITAKYELSLSMRAGEQEASGIVEFNISLFEEATIHRFIAHFQMLLAAVAKNPALPISRLSCLPEAERHRMLFTWNETIREYPREQTLNQLFRTQVERTPDAVAVVAGEEQLTYRELDLRANQLAHHLREAGLGPGRFAAVLADRSLETLVAFLATFQAGGAYLPLDPSFPTRRLHQIIDDAQPAVLLLQARYQSLVSRTKLASVILDTAIAEPIRIREPLSDTGLAQSLAYLIYTSGSTGTPKGVAVPQTAVTRLVRNTDYVALGPGDVIAHAANPAFDAATFEIWGALLNGARVVIIPQNVLLVPRKLAAYIHEERIDTLFLTTALFNQLARETPDIFNGMKQVLFGGEAVDPVWVDAVLSQDPPRRLLHVYGPTESTTYATWHTIDSVPEGARTLPIGKPLANTTAYLLDASLQPVPIGVHGELCLGGDGLARGYLARPAFTAQGFVPHPHSRREGERLYRTGDLARYDSSGAITFIGRRDHQVKLRGFRVELGDIDSAIREHPRVTAVVVVMREDQPGEKRLVAYVEPVPRPEDLPAAIPFETVDTEVLRSHLADKIPEYMIPSVFVVMDALPLNANGKIDVKALPLPEDETSDEPKESPRNPVEEAVARIWCDVMNREDIGIHENFFELGGHSLMATQIVSRIYGHYQIDLPMEALFESPSIAALSTIVDDYLVEEKSTAPLTIEPVDRESLIPVSFAQQRLWFIHTLTPESPHYNMPMPLRLEGTLNLSALEAALSQIVDRHESLRTVFAMVDQKPCQKILPSIPLSIPLIDLSGLGESFEGSEAERLLRMDATRPFSLEKGPLFRLSLARLAPDDQILLVTLHHIIGDGWSMGVLIREITECYRCMLRGQKASLPELPIQYADFAVWQRRKLEEGMWDEQLAFWRNQLEGIPPILGLPTARPRPPFQRFEGDTVPFTLDETLTRSLRKLANETESTLFMILLAAYALLLSRYSGQDDIVIGSPIANRNHHEIENLIGFFVNMLALRIDVSGNHDFRSLLDRVRQTTLAAYANQDISFESVVEALQPRRDMSHSPIFQVGIALQNTPSEDLSMPGLEVEILSSSASSAKWDLHLALSETESEITGGLEYSTNLFDREDVALMVQRYQTLLAGLISSPEQPLSHISTLTERESELIQRWNQTGTDFEDTCLIHEAVFRQAERTPNATALVFEDNRITYARLHQWSHRLAGELVRRGVKPETPVGLCLERSPRMVVALLAVLQAGGAFVPLDPEHPKARLHALSRQLPLVLTETRWAEKLEGISAELMVLPHDEEEESNVETASFPDPGLIPDNAAYMIYTSGSTGEPKLTVNTHGGIRNRLCWMRQVFPLTCEDLVLQKTPYTFDVSLWEIFWPLTSGARLVIARPSGHRDPLYLSSLIQRYSITNIHFVPSMLRAFLDAGEPDKCASLERIFTSGEALSPDLRDRCGERFNAERYNLYGPTEAAIEVTLSRCGNDKPGSKVSIGAPVANNRILIVDASGRIAPPGMPGELLIAGTQVSRGYLNQPGITAERFVPDPMPRQPGDRAYRSGDRARYLSGRSESDPAIEFLERIDHQVKLRGVRIELGEIESRLNLHPSVRQSVVVLHEDQPSHGYLAAYIVLGDSSEKSGNQSLQESGSSIEQDLEIFLRARLPEYMVPSTLVFLETLPLNASGKLDRHRLPKPERQKSADVYVAPRTDTEKDLAKLWEEVLGVDTVGVKDNFFALGGHSLLATQLVFLLREKRGWPMPLADVFTKPVLEDLANHLDEMESIMQTVQPPIADKLPEEEEFEL